MQDLPCFNGGSPGLMLFPKDGGCVLYSLKEGKFQRNLRDFSGSRFLANSGNWCLVLNSGSSLYIIDAFSEKTIPLPSLESIWPTTTFIKLKRVVLRHPWPHFYVLLQARDTYYTDVSLDLPDSRWLCGLSAMVLRVYRLYILKSRRYLRVLDLSGQQGFFKDITEGKPVSMLSNYQLWDSSIAVTTSGEVLLVESDPCNNSFFRLYKKNPHLEDPDSFSHTVLEIDSLDGEALLLDLGFTVPANETLGLEPDSIYFTRHYRPCQCSPRDVDICVFNLATKTLKRFPDLGDMNLMDARWFLPRT